jgi:UDPglucose--hexose-1-phosphate uridylyltransferase
LRDWYKRFSSFYIGKYTCFSIELLRKDGDFTLLEEACPLIDFRKVEKRQKILNPTKGFAEQETSFEYRTDPLTGRNTTVISGMLGYVARFLTSDKTVLDSLVEQSRVACPFCPENVRIKTPMFPPEFLKDGRIFVGEAVVVPNLTGHAEKSALAVLSKQHHLKLAEFVPKLLVDGFEGGSVYLKRLQETSSVTRFPVFIFNYLPPAGSSIFHPHMQILVRDRPFFLVKLMLDKSRAYFRKTGMSFWSDLLQEERVRDRYLMKKKLVEWIVPFAPLRGMNEVQAIVRGKSQLLELDGDDWFGLAEGISTVLGFYERQGYSCFNIILMSGPMDKHLDYFDVNLRIISRPGVQTTSFTDAWAAPYLLWDGEAVELPEQLAERIRDFISHKEGS